MNGSEENIVAATGETAPSDNRKDIWTLIKEAQKRDKSTEENSLETTLLFVGGKQSGKSTLIARLQQDAAASDSAPAPSTALEYTFARKNRVGGNGNIKDLAHIWELAGGTSLSSLSSICITEANVHLASLICCLDLAKPQEALLILLHFLTSIAARVKTICDGLEARGSKRPKGLKNFSWARVGADHPDKQYLTPFPIPLLIVGTRAEALSALEPEQRKMLCKVLRFLSHINGASLAFVAQKDEHSVARVSRKSKSNPV